MSQRCQTAVRVTVVLSVLSVLSSTTTFGDDGPDTRGCNAQHIRFTGGFAYYLPTTPPTLVGVDNIWVKIKDDDDVVEDDTMVEGYTDADGNFDLSVCWDSIDTPDVYAEFECETGAVVVQYNIATQTEYTWSSQIELDFEGSQLDFGVLAPTDPDDNPALHIHNNITRAHRWISEVAGIDVPQVDVLWPFDVNGPFYFSGQVYIDTEHSWAGATHIHEYGHHFMANFMPNGHVVIPDYCNGICDNQILFFDLPCGHCRWCGETPNTAWNEGWADWLGDAVTRHIDATYTPGAFNAYLIEDVWTSISDWSVESPEQCNPDQEPEDVGWYNPVNTEGFVAALLRDIEDPDVNDTADAFRPDFDGDHMPDPAPDCALDALAVDPLLIFEVSVQDDPSDVLGFINAFRARYPELSNPLWRTAWNLGRERFVAPDAAPPAAVPSLSSPSHPPGGGTWPVITIHWQPAPDDASGVSAYEVRWFEYGQWLPPFPPFCASFHTELISGATTANSRPVGLGEYCVEIRAQDCVGNWGPTTSWGRFVVNECNGNGILDVCETPRGCSQFPSLCSFADCDDQPDCNGNGAPDACDIANGASVDCNFNGIPDECESVTFVNWLGCVDCGCPPGDPNCTPVIDCTWDGVICWDNVLHSPWSNGSAPGPGDHVCVEAVPGSGQLRLDTGDANIASLVCHHPFRLEGGNLNPLERSAFFGPFTHFVGTFSSPADLEVFGPLAWSHGNMVGPVGGTAATTAHGGLTILGDTGWINKVLHNRVLRNPDHATWIGTAFVVLTGSARIENTGLFEALNDALILGEDATLFDNRGTFVKRIGSAASELRIPSANSGTVDIQSGTLQLNGGSQFRESSHSGEFLIAPGATLAFGHRHNLVPASSIRGEHVLFNGSALVNIDGLYDVSGITESTGGAATFNPGADLRNIGETLRCNDGTMNFNSGQPLTVTTYQHLYGTVNSSSEMSVTGLMDWRAGTIGVPPGTPTTPPPVLNAQSGLIIRPEIGGLACVISNRRLRILGTADWRTPGLLAVGGTGVIENRGAIDMTGTTNLAWNGGSPRFENFGTIVKSGDPGIATMGIDCSNAGDIDVFSGVMWYTAGFVQTDGSTTVHGAEIRKSAAALQIDGGRLRGDGLIAGAVSNAGGRVQPGLLAHRLTIHGNYSQGAAAALDIEIGGRVPFTSFDVLEITGSAALGGTLAVSFIDGFVPELGDEFVFLSAASRSGTFANLSLPNGYAGVVEYTPAAAVLRIDTTPSSCPGDLDGNGAVDIQDLAFLLSHFGTLSGASPSDGDTDGDGDVDIQDLANLLSLFGARCP